MHGYHKLTPGRQRSLCELEEKIIEAHLIALSLFGFPFTDYDLRITVKMYLDKVQKTIPAFKNNLPGKEWAKSFLRRRKQLSQRKAKNISVARAAVDEEAINQFFDNLEKELVGVPPENIINYDETNLGDDPGT